MPINQSASPITYLRARLVLPISRDPIPDGFVSFSGNRIVSVGRWQDLAPRDQSAARDLGKVILLPGLINAHCHLDYTGMAGQLTPPKRFIEWLQNITNNKAGWGYSDFAESWINGAKMLLATGTTTVSDIEMVPELLPEVWTATPMRIFSYLEMTGVRSRRPPTEIIREALEKIVTLPSSKCRVGLSPHAPYSTTPELLRLAAETSRKHSLGIVTHVAESDQEFEMFLHGRGEMYDWLSRSGRDMSDCGLGSPVQHLERQGALHQNLLAVHVNYLAPGDAKLLAKRKVSVVHCPRSHRYFKHQPFPIQELESAGVNICLGTDSLASVSKTGKKPLELNMFEEMRTLSRSIPFLPCRALVEMATIGGARALGMSGQLGELSPGALADLIAIPYGRISTDGYEDVIHHHGNVTASLIDGQWAISPKSSQ